MFRRSAKSPIQSRGQGQGQGQGQGLAQAPKPAAAGRLLPPGKEAYEARRAAKAGVSLERWMADKHKRAQAELAAARKQQARQQPSKPGLFKRLLDRAHKPL